MILGKFGENCDNYDFKDDYIDDISHSDVNEVEQTFQWSHWKIGNVDSNDNDQFLFQWQWW